MRYPDHFSQPYDANDAMPIFRSGRIISPLGLEGLHLIGNSYTKLRDYHARGVRRVTLTHNCHNAYADSALVETADGDVRPSEPQWGGVSLAGQHMIQEMNRLGILVDLSHTSANTMRHTLGNSETPTHGKQSWGGSIAPPIFSHSGAFSICPHPRNVPDDVLHLVAERGGLVMVTFSPDFVSCYWPGDIPVPGQLPERYQPNLTVSQVVRHMRYIGDLIGYEHVGVGSDFNGVPSTIPGLEDVSKFPHLVAEMLRQGIKDQDAKGIVGGNLLRVWKEADAVAERLRIDRVKPAEDDLPTLDDPWK